MLNDLDQELTRRGHAFVRYADDANIYVSSMKAGRRVYASIKRFINEHLKLKINEQKSAVDFPSRRKFLGFSFTGDEDARLTIAPKTKIRFKEKIRELTSRSQGISMNQRLKQLNSYLMGWSGYFGIAQTKSTFQSLDGWIRRRLRMCLLKQWKLWKTKLTNLIKLGIPKPWASPIAYSRKGDWRLANTPQINKALSLAYWREQGLISLVDRQSKMLLKASA
jgi:RNA-directed DNA polymerase